MTKIKKHRKTWTWNSVRNGKVVVNKGRVPSWMANVYINRSLIGSKQVQFKKYSGMDEAGSKIRKLREEARELWLKTYRDDLEYAKKMKERAEMEEDAISKFADWLEKRGKLKLNEDRGEDVLDMVVEWSKSQDSFERHFEDAAKKLENERVSVEAMLDDRYKAIVEARGSYNEDAGKFEVERKEIIIDTKTGKKAVHRNLFDVGDVWSGDKEIIKAFSKSANRGMRL